jgi:hypothetical protein
MAIEQNAPHVHTVGRASVKRPVIGIVRADPRGWTSAMSGWIGALSTRVYLGEVGHLI